MMRTRVIPLLMVAMMVLLVGCNANEIVQKAVHGSDTVSEIAQGGSVDAQGEIANEKQYIDQKTGQTITAAQYEWNNRSDMFKLYGLYIALFSFAFGFLIRRLVKSSASLRKFGLVLEVVVPFFYIFFAYIIAMLADNI
jgi:hypothetical protein